MNIVFCADQSVLPGLHVALYSVLDCYLGSTRSDFTIFSDVLDDGDIALLNQTLQSLKKPYSLELRRIDPGQFKGYPSLNGSWATYYRLAVPREMDVDRFLYLDADTLCDINVGLLQDLEMDDAPAALVPEAPLAGAVDRHVAEQLGNSPLEHYFNAGIMLVNRREWMRQGISERAVEYLKNNPAHFWDQSALNVVLHGKVLQLDEQFNTIVNMRKHWPVLKYSVGSIGRLLHFLAYPKPWDLGAEFIHPQYRIWRSVLDKTAMRDFRSWHDTPARRLPKTAKAKAGYKKAIKDRILFTGYTKGWFKRVKGL